MFKIFKTKIPSSSTQEVGILQSWTLTWKIQGNGYDAVESFTKCFIKHEEAVEYEKQLKNAADFLKAWVKTSIKEN